MRDDLAIFFKMVITRTEFFQRTVIKGFLIILDKLLPVGFFEWNKLYFSEYTTFLVAYLFRFSENIVI